MHQDKTGGRVNDHRAKYLPWMRQRLIQCAFENVHAGDPVILHVQEHHSHDLLSENTAFQGSHGRLPRPYPAGRTMPLPLSTSTSTARLSPLQPHAWSGTDATPETMRAPTLSTIRSAVGAHPPPSLSQPTSVGVPHRIRLMNHTAPGVHEPRSLPTF